MGCLETIFGHLSLTIATSRLSCDIAGFWRRIRPHLDVCIKEGDQVTLRIRVVVVRVRTRLRSIITPLSEFIGLLSQAEGLAIRRSGKVDEEWRID
jgi:hypothetical protein